jgi:thioredoxin reductase (NADPH)
MHLAKWAGQVTVLVRSQSLTDSMSDYLIREIDAAPNVEARCGVQVADGVGTDHLKSLVLGDVKARARCSVPADGLFVLIGSQPRTEWLGDSLARDRWGFILTGQDVLDGPAASWPEDRQPLLLETSLPGVFAAGDARRGAVQRVASAVGDGAITIPLVHRYLEGRAVSEAAAR